ncbi:MAG: hypothetical protein ACRD9R_16555 [Pyrinomonadaceae bacterium]
MKRNAATIILAALSALGGAAVSNRFFHATPTMAQAQPSERGRKPASPQWEYCSLTRATYPGRGGLYWVAYFRDNGAQVVEVEEQATERSGPAKAIAKLGEDGWEMVGHGPLEIRQGTLPAIYFKRLKQ